MALTKTTLCNMALSKLGSSRVQLSDFDNDTGEIKSQCALHYEPTLHELVRMHKWNCCKGRSKLTKTTTTNPKAPLFQFKQQHDLPNDYIRATYVTKTDEIYEYGMPIVDYSIEGDKLLSNHEEIWLCYEKEPTPAAMDPLFAQAFVTLLAVRLSVPLVGDRNLYVSLLDEFNNVIIPEAKRINAFEKKEAPIIDSEWLEAGYISGYNNSYPPFTQSSYGSF